MWDRVGMVLGNLSGIFIYILHDDVDSIQHYVIKFVSVLPQFGVLHRVSCLGV